MPSFSLPTWVGPALALLLGSASNAPAQQSDRPLMLPTSDVVVVYRLDRGPLDGPHKLQATYSAQGQRVRLDYFRWVEAKVPFLIRIFDRPRDRQIVIYTERKTYTDQPIGNSPNPGAFLREDTVFTRQGRDTVAHAPCTQWRIDFRDRSSGGDSACVTDDGIALRLASASPDFASLIAISVHYETPSEAAYQPPPGFRPEPSHQ
jgi:hypothetical protein